MRFHKPTLEVLEDRTLPAVATAGPVVLPPPLYAPPAQPAVANFYLVVPANASAIVVDLDAIYGANKETAIVGNTKPALVKASLSDGELTLTIIPGKSGTATITVRVTDVDYSSIRETIVVTVLP